MLESIPLLDGVRVTLTLGEVALRGKTTASPLALTIKPKTHVLLLVNHMQCFDVLTSHQWLGGGDKSWYLVTTVKARSESEARSVAKAKTPLIFESMQLFLLSTAVHGVGACGTYDKFIGKYVGQFIDEALCRK